MKHISFKKLRGLAAKGWLVVAPTVVVLVAVLALTDTGSAAPVVVQPHQARSTLQFQQEEPLCQDCHQEAYDMWKDSSHAKATLDPTFQDELHASLNQEACLACHTTGFDTGSGEFMAEGVTCEACHGPYKEGHPSAETMQLPMESTTCRMCHQSTFVQWESSAHAANRIDCFDCHKAHSQGLRLETVEKQCSACHADEQTELAHAVHGISGVACANCHMASEVSETGSMSGKSMSMSDHSFKVASDVCARCHMDTIHASEEEQSIQTSAPMPAAEAQAAIQIQDERVVELENLLNEAEKQISSLRNLSVTGIALALGGGGAVGVLIGFVAAMFWQRRRQS